MSSIKLVLLLFWLQLLALATVESDAEEQQYYVTPYGLKIYAADDYYYFEASAAIYSVLTLPTIIFNSANCNKQLT